jgi:hypothetical protein
MDDSEKFGVYHGAQGEIDDSAEFFTILQSGNVGIGTTSPMGKLAISTVPAASEALVVISSDSNSSHAAAGASVERSGEAPDGRPASKDTDTSTTSPLNASSAPEAEPEDGEPPPVAEQP